MPYFSFYALSPILRRLAEPILSLKELQKRNFAHSYPYLDFFNISRCVPWFAIFRSVFGQSSTLCGFGKANP